MFLYYRGVNPNVAVNGNVKFVDISERRSKRVKRHNDIVVYKTVVGFVICVIVLSFKFSEYMLEPSLCSKMRGSTKFAEKSRSSAFLKR